MKLLYSPHRNLSCSSSLAFSMSISRAMWLSLGWKQSCFFSFLVALYSPFRLPSYLLSLPYIVIKHEHSLYIGQIRIFLTDVVFLGLTPGTCFITTQDVLGKLWYPSQCKISKFEDVSNGRNKFYPRAKLK